MRTFGLAMALVGGFLLGACGAPGGGGGSQTDGSPADSDATPEDGGQADAHGPDGGLDGISACGPGSRWTAGTRVFEEATDAWGLAGVTGSTFSVVDFDGDGWPDLFVRHGDGEKDYAPGVWLLRNTGEGTFEDVTEASGLLAPRQSDAPVAWRPAHATAWGDVDNDGHLDAYIGFGTKDGTSANGETPEIMLSNGDGTFRLGPEANMARRAGLVNKPEGATFLDFDRDGFLDLWVTHHDFVPEGGGMEPIADHLYKGDGTGMFIDVSSKTGVVSFPWGDVNKLNDGLGHSWAWSGAACDLNGDGTPELLAAAYGRAPNLLWQGVRHGDGSVEYVNRSVYSGYAFDHREDWTDNWSARCFCQENPDAEDCQLTEAINVQVCEGLKQSFGDNMRWYHAGDREPWRLGGNSGTTLCADVNNDGHLDLFTNEIVHADVGQSADPSELMVNTGEAEVRFERPGPEATGITREHEPGSYWDHGDMTSAILDMDNDGWLDVYIGASDYPGNRGVLYHQQSALSFVQLSTDDFFEHNRSYGVVAADFDRDGDLDLLLGHSHMRCNPDGLNDCYPTRQTRLMENVLGQSGHWLQLVLTGAAGTNGAAVGARVEVTANGITQTREVEGGHGKGGFQDGMVLHVGLGDACEGDVTIRWPDASLSIQSFTVDGDARYRVTQGQEPVLSAP